MTPRHLTRKKKTYNRHHHHHHRRRRRLRQAITGRRSSAATSPARRPSLEPRRGAPPTPEGRTTTGSNDEPDDGDLAMDDDVPPEYSAAVGKVAELHRSTRGYAEYQRRLDSDTEADADAAPAGAGPRGSGPPLHVGAHHRRRELCDGAGLCSLGRWPPWRRPASLAPPLAQVRRLIMNYVHNLYYHIGVNAQTLFHQLAKGEVDSDPFERDPAGLRRLIDEVQIALEDKTGSAVAQTGDLAQPVRIRMLQRVLLLGGDPDHAGMEHFCKGVRIGVGTVMPRTPAVYARKRKWRLEGQGDPEFDAEGERRALGDAWRDNNLSRQTS